MPVDDSGIRRPPPPGLASLGLSQGEQVAYELLVDRQRATVRQLSAAWRRPESLPEILADLEVKGLAVKDPARPDRYLASNPRSALDSLLRAREWELEAAATYSADLVARYAGTGGGTPSLVEVVTGHRAVHQRLTQIERSSRDEVCRLHNLAGIDVAGFSLDVRALVGRNVRVRTVYDRGCIEERGGFAEVERSIDAGEQARIATVPTAVIVIDRRLAYLPLERAPESVESAMIVHPSGLLDALAALFDELWRRAVSLPMVTRDEPEFASGGRSDAEERLIALLLSGLTDQAIARQLGTGHRTVQRRVAGLAQDLGAHSRFQAGVQVALRQPRDETG